MYLCDCSLQCFGASFLQSDLAVFKQNLTALESLNTKHKLYSRVSKHTHTRTHARTHTHAHTPHTPSGDMLAVRANIGIAIIRHSHQDPGSWYTHTPSFTSTIIIILQG